MAHLQQPWGSFFPPGRRHYVYSYMGVWNSKNLFSHLRGEFQAILVWFGGSPPENFESLDSKWLIYSSPDGLFPTRVAPLCV